jgi:hypothetical protein
MSDVPNHSDAAVPAATTMPAESGPAPYRFSLLTLLSVTTLAGLTFAVLFSPGWDPAERLLMAFWCAGLLVGASLGRARGKPGVFSAGVGAALGCTVATFVLHSGKLAAHQFGENLFVPFLVFVVTAGWFLAVGVTALYHALMAGLIEAWWRPQSVRRFAVVAGGLAVVVVIAWQSLQQREWKRAHEFDVGLESVSVELRSVPISPLGDRLLVPAKSPRRITESDETRLITLTSRVEDARPFPLEWGLACVFSPDGKRLAAGRGEFIRVVEVPAGTPTWVRVLDLRPVEEIGQFLFSADNQRLIVTTHTPRIQRLYSYDLATNQPPQLELFPFPGHLFVSDDNRWLVKLFDAADETDARSLEIVNLATRETICRLEDIAGFERPVFSMSGDRMAIGSRIWQLPGGRSAAVEGKVVGLLSRGRMLVVAQQSNAAPAILPDWMPRMPFVQHLFPRGTQSQLRVIDEATGRVLLATSWQEEIEHVSLSANQQVAVSTSSTGKIRLWHVPP